MIARRTYLDRAFRRAFKTTPGVCRVVIPKLQKVLRRSELLSVVPTNGTGKRARALSPTGNKFIVVHLTMYQKIDGLISTNITE
jgi:hypothetical protein